MVENSDNSKVTGVAAGTILVVDDEQYVREVLVEILKSLGYDTIVACDGYEGLERFQSEQSEIDACVIDVAMPGMAGLELLEKIRLFSADVPIVIVSGYSRHEVRQKEARSENVSFLQKPFTRNQVKEVLEAQLSP